MDFHEYRNPAFQAAEAAARMQALVQSFLAQTSREGLSISDADLAEIDRAAAAAQARLAEGFGIIREQAVARRSNLETFEDVAFVSVGEDCFSRTLLTRWGLKKSAKLGERSGPFDLSVNRLRVATAMIENDFRRYLDPADLAYSEKAGHCFNRRTGVQFNHETGPEYAQDGFAPLIARYQPRIETFRRVMASDQPIALVFHGCRPHEAALGDGLARLWDGIAGRWGGANKRLIAVNTWPHGAEIRPTEALRPEITVLDIAYPAPGYIWHPPRFAFSDAGVAFERRVVDFVRREAEVLLPRVMSSAA